MALARPTQTHRTQANQAGSTRPSSAARWRRRPRRRVTLRGGAASIPRRWQAPIITRGCMPVASVGVAGFQHFMNAEQYVIDPPLADFTSQSCGAGEGSSQNGPAALQNLRRPSISAQPNHFTALPFWGDNATANIMKEPVKKPALI